MRSAARVWLTVGPLALAAGGGALALVLTSGHEENEIRTSILGLLVGWSFVIAGLIAQTRRPENRTGALLLLVGFTFFVGALAESNNSLVFSLGHVFGAIFIGALVHLLLAYPSGRLASARERAFVVAGYAVAFLANAAPILFDRSPTPDCASCPENAFLVSDNETADDVLSVLFEGLGFVLLAVVVVLLVRRWRSSSPAARRLLGPVLLAGGATVFFFAVSIAVYPLSSAAAELIGVGALATFVATPFVFLWGVLRSRLVRPDLGALLVDSTDTPTLGETQDALRGLLRDPTLELFYWVEEVDSYYDVERRRRELSEVASERAVTEVDSEDGPLAALVYDPVLAGESERIAGVTAALRLRLEKDRSVRELRISEYRSRALLNAIPDTMFRVARDGTVLDIHSHDPENVVIPPEEMIGTSLYDIPADVISRQTMEERKVLVERAFETGEPQTQEYEINAPFGRRFAETRIVPSGEDEFVMIVRDVTDERLAESRRRALLEAMPDAMFRISREGRFLDFRTPRPEMLVIPSDVIVGSSVYDIPPDRLTPEVVRERMALAERAFATGEVQTHKYEMRSPDGDTMYSEARIVPSGEDEWVMIVRDVTSERLTESRSEALLEALPDAVFRLTRDGIYLDFRSPDAEQHGVDPESFIGTSIRDALPAEVAERVLAAAEQAFETGDVQTIEGEMDNEGTRFHAEARIVPSGDNEFVMIVRDVTQRREAESELRRLHAELQAHAEAIQRQRDVLSAMGDATTGLLCVVELDGRIGMDALNLPLRTLTGYPQYEVDGLPFWDVFPAPEEAAEAERVVREVAAGGNPGEQESRWLTKGGDELLVAWTCTPIPGIEEMPRMLVSGVDVTDRARHQEQLETERDYLSAVTDATPSVMCRIDYEGRLGNFGLNRTLQALTGYAEGELAGRLFSEVFSASEDAEAVQRVIEAVAEGGAPAEQETHWLTKDGRRVLVAWTCTPLPARGADRRLQISGIDVTERKQREDEQAALRRVAVAVASERRPEDVFQTVTEEAGRLLGGDGSYMLRYDPEANEALVVGSWRRGDAVQDDTVIGRRISLKGGPASIVRKTGRTMRFEPGQKLEPGFLERLRAEQTSSIVTAPVLVAGRVWGTVSVVLNEGLFPPETEDRIAQFSSLVATALANAEAREELHASRARIVEAGDAERRRLERNLHDGAQQRLVSLSLSLRLAQAKLRSDAHAADEILSGASIELALALEELRELARGIHPAVLTDRGLGPALESLADRTPLPVQLDQLPDGRLPAPVEAAAFYVVSEALANVTKYAEASNVSVRVAHENGYAVVEVSDDGIGGADPQGGSGLRGLSDRVAALEGRLAIVSPPGAGTRIRAEIPFG